MGANDDDDVRDTSTPPTQAPDPGPSVTPDQDPAPEASTRKVGLATIRRRPNIPIFLIVFGLVGTIAGAIIGARGGSTNYDNGSAIGYLAVMFGALGVLIGGIVVVVIDRVIDFRARKDDAAARRSARPSSNDDPPAAR